MAKATTIKVKLVSSADTGFYYVTRKNSRTMTDKLVKKKYDPVAKKHVEFREVKIKMVSSADTGYYYVTKKNSRTKTDKLVKKKYDPVAKRHVEFREGKIK